ncbi:colicin D family protein [Clostridium argentinense CDC 2741]|uniref:Colicin D family protein n=2 Tax=Clostridium TaxID=1485 RepID=A0A0C1R695_9CLOT|nr:colicin D domain-containing protein [Clostridium argentinense]ARC83442.1 hypothetical protein RSJ17_02240 [Clostridium argentinense]KIE45981.1 colicin D family protein [Clostridium argentinense CDC 2741]NFF39113.1 hypothetical protein [Clostridium argentinense]NFP49525.1 hypothetical protein [Clostridium argentinense]NFP72228.1 hypothetical protein [Clostridium argentinense]
MVASVATFGVGATLAVAAVGAIVAGAAVGAAKAGVDNVNSQLSKNGGDISKTDYGEVLKAEFWGAMTGAANMFKTELYAAINIGIQYISNMTRIANTIQKNMPWNYKYAYTRMEFDARGEAIKEEARQIRESLRNEAPYKTAFDVTEFVFDVATLANGVKSIGNIGKNLPGKISIGQLSLSGTGINVPVLCLDGVTSIASVGEISSIATSGLAFYNMTSNSGSGGDSNSSSNENIDASDAKGVGETAELPDATFTTKKLQHEFKHAGDFDVTGNWNKATGEVYQKAIQNHIETATDVYKSTYRGDDVYVYINKNTSVGAYTDLSGNYIGGWKFNSNQIDFHLGNGIKIK